MNPLTLTARRLQQLRIYYGSYSEHMLCSAKLSALLMLVRADKLVSVESNRVIVDSNIIHRILHFKRIIKCLI